MSKNNLSFYPALMAGFSVVLVCANFIGPAKVCEIELPIALPILGSVLIFGAGNIFFPISYIFGDILTEVYGYAKARKVTEHTLDNSWQKKIVAAFCFNELKNYR